MCIILGLVLWVGYFFECRFPVDDVHHRLQVGLLGGIQLPLRLTEIEAGGKPFGKFYLLFFLDALGEVQVVFGGRVFLDAEFVIAFRAFVLQF